MALVKSVQIDIGVKGDAASKAKLDAISARAEELKKAFPEYKLKIDGAAATERLKVFRQQLRDIPDETTTKVKVKVDDSALSKLAGKMGGFSAGGTALGLSPALIPLAAGIASGVAAIGVSFAAAVTGAGLFGVAAKSVLTSAGSDAQKMQALNQAAGTQTAALAASQGQAMASLQTRLGQATTKAQRKSLEQQIANLKASQGRQTAVMTTAQQQQVQALTKGWSKGYATLVRQQQTFQDRWKAVSRSIAVPALNSWMGALIGGMPLLATAVKPVAAVFQDWGNILRQNFADPAIMKHLQGMAAAFGQFSAGQLRLVGGAIANIARGFFNLGKDLAGSGANFSAAGIWIYNMGDAFLSWSKSAKARTDVQGFMHYLHQEGPVVGSILQSLGKILPGVFQGASSAGALELKAIAGLLGLIARLPKGWQAPLTEAAGAILLMSKTGVMKLGFAIGGSAAGAAIRSAMVSGGAAAAGEIRAAMTGGAAAGAGEAGGAVAAGGLAAKFAKVGRVAGLAFAVAALDIMVADFFDKVGEKFSHMKFPGHNFEASVLHFGSVLMRNGGPFSASFWSAISQTIVNHFRTPVELTFLRTALSITGTFGKLPGPLGAPFRKAHEAIAGELAGIQWKAAQTARQINADWAGLHGKDVTLGYHLKLPLGLKLPRNQVFLHPAGYAAGTGGAAPGWAWVGERGPELVHMRGGETVVPHHKIGGYAQGTVENISGSFPGAGIVAQSVNAMQGITGRLASAIKSAIGILQVPYSPPGAFGAGPGGGAPRANAALARRLMPTWGSGAEWASWNALEMGEAGWNQFARNASSGAYGIPQALPPSKMGAAANPPQSNPAAQIRWMIGYIRSTYGDPIRAYSTWSARSPHWYDQGGWLMPGLTMAVNKTGRPERVLPPGQSGGGPVRVELVVRTVAGEVVQVVQHHVSVNGGNVQVALGER